jgi:hypothetical protein
MKYTYPLKKTKFSLDEKIVFYIPSKRKDDTELGILLRAQATHAVMNFLLKELGGATLIEGKGYFADKSGKIHCENTTLCISYCRKSKFSSSWMMKEIELIANSLAIELEQDTLAVSINDILLPYSPKEQYRNKYPSLIEQNPFGFRKYLNLKSLSSKP